jgi:hypothetical protein
MRLAWKHLPGCCAYFALLSATKKDKFYSIDQGILTEGDTVQLTSLLRWVVLKKKKKYSFSMISNWSELDCERRSFVLILPLQEGFPALTHGYCYITKNIFELWLLVRVAIGKHLISGYVVLMRHKSLKAARKIQPKIL